MSHDSAVPRALEGSFRKERRTGKEKGRCRKVGNRRLRSGEEGKDAVRTVLQSEPLRFRTEKDAPKM